jgi:hypothetical protein
VSLADRIIYERPEDPQLHVEKTPVSGVECPKCGSDDIRRYPIAWTRGPRIAVKCQACYEPVSIERPASDEPWPPFRAVAYDWDVSDAERPSAPSRRKERAS